MKKLITLFTVLLTGFSFAQTAQNETAMKYAETITIDDMKEDLTILASDALEGRETGKRGQKMAAAYIRAHFEELGLTGPVVDGPNPYYQNVLLKSSKPGDIYIKIGDTKLKNLDKVLYYGSLATVGEVTTEIVFVGAGAEEDFNSVDVNGKSVLLLNESRAERGKAMKLAYQNGAKMVFILRTTSEEDFAKMFKMFANYFSNGSLGLADNNSKDESSTGAFYISPSQAEEIFGKSVDKLTKAIADKENGNKKALKKIKHGKVSFKVGFNTKDIISENVLGFLEGTDLKDEILVLTAHYDHLGVGKDGQIYNGADDDGSGTVAVMDIAEAFIKAKADGNGPRRSILFMMVTGEEKGLLGSAYYANNPIFSLKSTVVDLNIDMIGRIDDRELESENYVSLVGADKLSTELHEISERANELYTNMFLDYTYNDENHPERIYYRSDHWNFAKNGIPVIFYTTGSHPDYHKSSDTVDKIEFELMTKRAKLVFYTAWEIANRDGRLIVDKKMDPTAKR